MFYKRIKVNTDSMWEQSFSLKEIFYSPKACMFDYLESKFAFRC